MKIPVFVSCPTKLSAEQDQKRSIIIDGLISLNMDARALGRSDFGTKFPLEEVRSIARLCAGGVILGFRQTSITTNDDKILSHPTPWNNLEAGILYALNKPLIVFKEDGISGGVFDIGVTDLFIHSMPERSNDDLREIMVKWSASVIQAFYSR